MNGKDCSRPRAILFSFGSTACAPKQSQPSRKKSPAFRPEMAVHGRYGKPCPRCGEKSPTHSLRQQRDQLLRPLPNRRKSPRRPQPVPPVAIGLATYPRRARGPEAPLIFISDESRDSTYPSVLGSCLKRRGRAAFRPRYLAPLIYAALKAPALPRNCSSHNHNRNPSRDQRPHKIHQIVV